MKCLIYCGTWSAGLHPREAHNEPLLAERDVVLHNELFYLRSNDITRNASLHTDRAGTGDH